jgi:hypothetical protein
MPIFNVSTKTPQRGWRCPSSEQLAAYVDGAVSAVQRQSLEEHLSDCSYCLDLVAGAISETRHTAPATPNWLRQRAVDQGGRARSNNWRWAWAIAPVLTCLVVVALLVKSPSKLKEMAPPGGSNNSPATTSPQPSTRMNNHPAEPTRSAKGQTELLRLITPSKGTTLKPNQLWFEWTATPNASYYQIRIMTAEGQLVWEGRSDLAHVQVPSVPRIAPGDYFVWVSAYLNDGRELQSSPTRFRVLAER